MSILEKLYNRSDPKWAHPELAEVWTIGGPGPYGTFLNTKDYSFEERLELVQSMIDATKVAMPPIESEVYFVKGCEEESDAPEVKIHIIYPEKRGKKKLPCLYAVPGGGLSFCIPEATMHEYKKFANEAGCVLATIQYRTVYSGDGGYPKTINDLQAGYKWLIENAAMLGINPDKIVVNGNSSGSHLALAFCHRMKKYNWYGYKARGCVVNASITDDRTCYPSNKLFLEGGWNSADNETAARLWLGREDYSRLPAEAMPNHATAEECIGLPPTFIHADEHDPLSDSSSVYASKLVEAGVYTEFHRWGGSTHGLIAHSSAGDGEYPNRVRSILYGNIKDCFKYDLRRDWIFDEE